jgi:antitoxin component YwqK of YwqJK toxin-antitoxin module
MGGCMKYLYVVLAILMGVAFASYCVYAAEEESRTRVVPRKVSIDTNYNGKPDRIEYYNKDGQVEKVEIDKDENGHITETIVYENGKPVRHEKDTNQDGKADVWIDY